MEKPKKIHLIDIGDAVMYDLAIALKHAGHMITGSDEDISEAAKSKLLKYNLLPAKVGWHAEKIENSLNAVIIGAQTKADNPELKRAQELKLPIFSFPEFLYQQSKDKQRVVVSGSYGKMTITALIIHVLNFHNRKFDYVTTNHAPGLDNLVRLSDAPLIIIEGQDVMASVLDHTPAFLKYHHHIGVISGIEWQESEAYPTREDYVRQFGLFASATPKGGVLVYFEIDPVVAALPKMDKTDLTFVPYKTHPSVHEGNREFLLTSAKEPLPLKISGKHNLQNISAAQETLKRIGITSELFYQAVTSFAGIGH